MKIKKFNESSENQIFTNKLIQKVCEDYYDLKHVVRKYIIWKLNIPDDEDIFPESLTADGVNLYVEYSNSNGKYREFDIDDMDEFVDFQKNPDAYMATKKYNL